MVRFFDAELGTLFIETPLHHVGFLLDLALHLVAGIAQLAHGAAERTRNVRYTLAAKEEQDEQQDDDQLPAADIQE